MEAQQFAYNRAKIWQIGFFALNNTATNIFLFGMIYVNIYAGNIAGLGVVLVSTLLTAMRIFDGITDPIIGFIIDKTNSKFGKFRPSMVLGYVIMTIATIILFNTLHLIPGGDFARTLYFILVYGIYIIGYTFQTACTKAAQACLTNDPKQRPLFSMFDGIYNTILFTGLALVVSNYLVPKHGDFVLPLFHDLITYVIVGSGLCTILAVVGIWKKDRTENFGLGAKTPQVKFRDYIDVIKNNRAIQMLIFAASTDKLAGSTMGNSVVPIIIYAVVAGNYLLSGDIALWSMIPTTVLLIIGVMMARKMGQKKALVVFTWIPMITSIILVVMLLSPPVRSMTLDSFHLFTIAYIIVLVLTNGTRGVSGNIVIPMIADCADYETYRSGKYVPGMMGTLFSFVDKLISSLANTVVGLMLALIGFTEAFPTVETPYSTELHYVGVFLFLGMPIIGWICSLIAMRFYPLTREKMEEVQKEISRIKAEQSVAEIKE